MWGGSVLDRPRRWTCRSSCFDQIVVVVVNEERRSGGSCFGQIVIVAINEEQGSRE